MAENTNRMMWIARISAGLGVVGIIFAFIPFVCVTSLLFSQAAIVMGLIAFVDSYKHDNMNNRILGIVGLVIGLVGLIIQAIMYISGWRLIAIGP